MASFPSVSNASYWQYKEDTSYVLKWIEQTAKACGWKRQQTEQTTPAPSSGTSSTQRPTKMVVPTKATTSSGSSGRLKGKDRKAAKQQAAAEIAAANEKKKKDEDERGVVLTALEILEQANLISARLTKSDSSACRPPSSVIHALGRAIKLRQRFSNWFEITRPDDHKSNSAHRYFVNVLEKIADLFLQAVRKTVTNSKTSPTRDAISGASRAEKQNLYESLLEQAVQNESESSPVDAVELSGPSIKEEAATSGRKYHMEVKDSQENALMVFTLFIDLHKIKSEIKSLWKRCIKEDADVVVTTLLTTQALDFVQRSEERVVSVLGEAGYRKDSWIGEAPLAWSFPGTYCQLLSTLRDPTDTQAVLRFEESSQVVEEGEEPVNMNSLTFSFSARRLSYTAAVEKNCVFTEPLLELFELDQHALLNADIDSVLDRDRRLCRLLFGLMRLGFTPPGEPLEGCPQRTRQNWSVRKDPIITCLMPLCSRLEVNLSSVFAAEVMLDIEEISNAFATSRTSYDGTFDRYMSLLGLQIVDDAAPDGGMFTHTEDSPLVRGSGYEGWFEKAEEILIRAFCLLQVPADFRHRYQYEREVARKKEFDEYCGDSFNLYAALDPLSLKYTKDEYQRFGLFDHIPLLPHIDYVFKSYPIFATHREAFMQTLAESAGIDVLNVNKHTIGAMAHLYNASQQLGLGNLKWPTMDRLIDLHKVALFAGDIPTTPAAMLKSFSHRYWGPKGKMSRKAKQKRMNRPITLMKPSAMTQAFNEHWDTAGRIPFWYTLESNALAAAAEKKSGNRKAVSTIPNFLENMSAMEDYLTKQLRDVRVDYMEIDRAGVDFNKNLLKHAREKFGKQANRVLQDEADDEWSGIDFVSESFEQEAQLHEAMSKCSGDPSKLPVQDCDYLQDSINCLASCLRAKGIGGCPDVSDEEGVNMPTSLTRFRIRGSEDLPDMRRLVLVSHCSCCHRKHYF